MCGRFSLSVTPQKLQALLGLPVPDYYLPRWNITPDSELLTVRTAKEGGQVVTPMRWGMLAPWSNDPKDPGRQINARSETALEKPTFRESMRRWRCLIPADGFYEWQKEGTGPSRPFRVELANGEPFCFAGLFRPTRMPDGSWLLTCTILTCDACSSIRGIHARMPIILPRDVQAGWLNREIVEPEAIGRLLVPRPEDELVAYEISRKVNNPRFDDASILERAA
jgi:putative SOS response-associated peptidase YedK